jgi:diguanylate cyclase (GGDEF)-like protein
MNFFRLRNALSLWVDTVPMSAGFTTKRGYDLPTAGSEKALAEVEDALNHPGYKLTFMPRLEAAYQAVRGPVRNRNIAKYLIVYLAAKLLFLYANLHVGSQVFRISMELRLGIVLPLTLLSVYLLLRPMRPWIHGIAAFAPLIAETALVMLLGRLSGSAVTDRYVIAAGVGIFAQTLLMQAPFQYNVTGLAAALGVFTALCRVRWPWHFGPPISADEIIFVVVFSLPALFERYNRERADRREFLLGELNRIRTEDILRMNAHLERLSSLDGLTGIFNRRYLDAALARLSKVAMENRRWISVLMIDIDHFKTLNDMAGHQHGDFCLEQVAQLLQQQVRVGMDTVARYGGEEFVAILPDAEEPEAVVVAERLRRAIETAGIPAATGAVVTISIGVASLCGAAGEPFTAADLIASADHALYEAKRSGRNRVICSAHERATV